MIPNSNRLSNVSQKMNAHWQPVWLKVRSPSRFTVVAFLFLFVLTTSYYRFGTTSYGHSEGLFSSHVADATNSTLGVSSEYGVEILWFEISRLTSLWDLVSNDSRSFPKAELANSRIGSSCQPDWTHDIHSSAASKFTGVH